MMAGNLGGLVLAVLTGLLVWVAIGTSAVAPDHAAWTAGAKPIEWDPEPANCDAGCLKGYRWGIEHEVTERHDCRTLPPDALDGSLLVVREVERLNAEGRLSLRSL